MRAIIGLSMLCTSLFAVNPTAPNDTLKNYSGDFTDTDGDGMTDVYEVKYGYDPNDAESFPEADFVEPDLVVDNFRNLDNGVGGLRVGSGEHYLVFEFNNWFDDFHYDATSVFSPEGMGPVEPTFSKRENGKVERATIDLVKYGLTGNEKLIVDPFPKILSALRRRALRHRLPDRGQLQTRRGRHCVGQ